MVITFFHFKIDYNSYRIDLYGSLLGWQNCVETHVSSCGNMLEGQTKDHEGDENML